MVLPPPKGPLRAQASGLRLLTQPVRLTGTAMLSFRLKSRRIYGYRRLHVDFHRKARLFGYMSEDEENRRNLITRLFYLLTVAGEECAELAAKGQSGKGDIDARQAGMALIDIGKRIEILAEAIVGISSDPTGE